MDEWPKAVKVHFESDPVVEFFSKIETIHLPIVPLYIFMYVSELYVFLRAFTKTFKERACTKTYCRENRRAMMMIKFIWLVFVPLLLTTTPRRLCLFQALILALISIALYISALTKKASCRSALLTTTKPHAPPKTSECCAKTAVPASKQQNGSISDAGMSPSRGQR